jgi:hypothetical protein
MTAISKTFFFSKLSGLGVWELSTSFWEEKRFVGSATGEKVWPGSSVTLLEKEGVLPVK